MKYWVVDRYPSEPKKEVTNEQEIFFYDDDGKYLGTVRPRWNPGGEFSLDVIGNKNLRINVLSYKEEPIDSNWTQFGARTSTSTTIREGERE